MPPNLLLPIVAVLVLATPSVTLAQPLRATATTPVTTRVTLPGAAGSSTIAPTAPLINANTTPGAKLTPVVALPKGATSGALPGIRPHAGLDFAILAANPMALAGAYLRAAVNGATGEATGFAGLDAVGRKTLLGLKDAQLGVVEAYRPWLWLPNEHEFRAAVGGQESGRFVYLSLRRVAGVAWRLGDIDVNPQPRLVVVSEAVDAAAGDAPSVTGPGAQRVTGSDTPRVTGNDLVHLRATDFPANTRLELRLQRDPSSGGAGFAVGKTDATGTLDLSARLPGSIAGLPVTAGNLTLVAVAAGVSASRPVAFTPNLSARDLDARVNLPGAGLSFAYPSGLHAVPGESAVSLLDPRSGQEVASVSVVNRPGYAFGISLSDYLSNFAPLNYEEATDPLSLKALNGAPRRAFVGAWAARAGGVFGPLGLVALDEDALTFAVVRAAPEDGFMIEALTLSLAGKP